MITIDKGIPVPEQTQQSAGRKPLYPWRDMQIGDSFLHPLKQKSVTGAAVVAARRTGFTFKTAKAEGGTRVWRVK